MFNILWCLLAFIMVSFNGAQAETDSQIVSWGTGFIVDHSGHLLTARHVVAGCRGVAIERGETRYPAVVTRQSESDDLAVVQSASDIGDPLAFAVDTGDQAGLVTVLGYATLSEAQQPDAQDGTAGFNAMVLDDPESETMTLASSARPGASGSPVLADDGRVVGVLVSRSLRSGGGRFARIPREVHNAVRADRAVAFLQQIGVSVSEAAPPRQGILDPLALLARSEVRVECLAE